MISGKGNLIRLYTELPFIRQQCLSGSCSKLAIVRRTVLRPREFLSYWEDFSYEA